MLGREGRRGERGEEEGGERQRGRGREGGRRDILQDDVGSSNRDSISNVRAAYINSCWTRVFHISRLISSLKTH